MKRNDAMIICQLLVLLVCLAACSPDGSDAKSERSDSTRDGPLVVAAVNEPLACFAARIGDDAVRVLLPSLPGDPAYWSPPAEVIGEFQQADLIVRNGAGYAGWVDRASLPDSRMIDTTAAHREQLLTVDDQLTHAHGPQGEHAHGGTAFTTWLDLSLAVEQARSILDALVRLQPEREADLRAGFAQLETELMALDAQLMAAADPELPLLGSHPVYQYLARRYALDLRSVHWEPDELPTPEQWRELEELLIAHPARWMLWEGEPREETVARLGTLGVESVVFAPCGNRPEGSDFLQVMARNAQTLQSILVRSPR